LLLVSDTDAGKFPPAVRRRLALIYV
jgi:hypothetical protein